MAKKESTKEYYDAEASTYHNLYTEKCNRYPANAIRAELVAKRLAAVGAKTVLDVGCGECTPTVNLLKAGFDVYGFDVSKKMVAYGKKRLEDAGFDANRISLGDIEDKKTLPDRTFDAVILLGSFPHVVDENKALDNVGRLLSKGGVMLNELRNELFSLFTLNHHSKDFILNKLIGVNALSSGVSKEVIGFYSRLFNRDDMKATYIRYAKETLTRFHNPLTVNETLFEPNGFSVKGIHFYHFHFIPPLFELKHRELFNARSYCMENASDWRGYFMASAFVAEAIKK